MLLTGQGRAELKMTAGFSNTKIWVMALPGEESVMCRITAPPKKNIHVLIPENTFPANMTGQGRAKLKNHWI